ncbi:MAG: UMP kinase [Gammaproteobacteria bacterium]|nr:UMP kinase [Gammaproteobacteria bacterium]
MTKSPIYKRILLKMSGEALMGKNGFGIDSNVLHRIAKEIHDIFELNVQIGIVIGGGNFFRGAKLAITGLDRVTADHIGMLATLINALALQDVLGQHKIPTQIMSAIPFDGVCEKYNRQQAIQVLTKRKVLIFAAGTGNPLFTTDSAASLRAIETQADIVLKATNVDGVYTADPKQDTKAKLYKKVSFQEAIQRELGVMDLPALCLCRDHNMPIQVFNIQKPGALARVTCGQAEGTKVS